MISVRQLDAASNAQVRLANTRADLDALLRIQLAEETGLRGYLSTHDPQFFGADRPPDPEFERLAAPLERRLRSDGIVDAADTVTNMRAVHQQWEQRVALPLINDPVGRDAYARQSTGKYLTDRMSEDAAQVRAALVAAGMQVERTLRRRINAIVAINAGVIALFAIVALGYAIGSANVAARLVHERSLVDALQRTLRVRGRRLAGTEMGTAYASATREALVGGDLLDAWRSRDGRGWFLIADASGKGIDAARHAAFVQYAVRALAAESEDPAEIVGRFNRLFLDTFDDPSVFVVLFLGQFDARARTLRYASAGHGTAYVRRGTLIEQLPPTGSIVGIDRDEAFTNAVVPLALGDIVLLATDGVGEARDKAGELLGEDRIAAILRDAPADPQTLCDLLVAEADRHSGGVQDDLAIIALRVVQEDDNAATSFGTFGARSVL